MRVCARAHMSACGDQRGYQDFPLSFSTLFLETGLLIEPGRSVLVQLGWLGTEPARSSCLHPDAGVTALSDRAWLCMGTEQLNLRPHVFTASRLPSSLMDLSAVRESSFGQCAGHWSHLAIDCSYCNCGMHCSHI